MIQIFNGEPNNIRDIPAGMFKICPLSDIDINKVKPDEQVKTKTERERLFLCRYCKNNITTPKYAIEIDGKYNHTFTNPLGKTFRIGCFLSAKGCLNYGEHTLENTWFQGFTWCYALCSECHSHLGWFYIKGSENFYGLISENLIENI